QPIVHIGQTPYQVFALLLTVVFNKQYRAFVAKSTGTARDHLPLHALNVDLDEMNRLSLQYLIQRQDLHGLPFPETKLDAAEVSGSAVFYRRDLDDPGFFSERRVQRRDIGHLVQRQISVEHLIKLALRLDRQDDTRRADHVGQGNRENPDIGPDIDDAP